MKLGERTPLLQRFEDKYIPDPNSGCWLWIGTVDVSGYGIMWNAQQRMTKAHRIAYELFVGPIPNDLQIDHLCRVRSCVNPRHLEPVTLQENLRRGLRTGPAIKAFQKKRAAISHCPRGHEYTPGNTKIYKNMRSCLECNRTRAREYQRRKRQIAPPPL